MNSLKSTTLSLVSVSMLSGCLIDSPYWGQEFTSHTSKIPIQAWTNHASHTVRVECSKAFHGGLYPPFDGSWSGIRNLTPQQPGVLDPGGARIYSVGTKMRIPTKCWRSQNTTNGVRFYTALRMIQTKPKLSGNGFEDIKFSVVDKKGLECVGRENGKAGSWYGYIVQGCTLKYQNSTTQIPYVIFKASS